MGVKLRMSAGALPAPLPIVKKRSNMMQVFSTELAEREGLQGAVIIQRLAYVIMKRKASENHMEGYAEHKYWYTTGIMGLLRDLPYISYGHIRGTIDGLVSRGLLQKIVFNQTKERGRRPNWYTFTADGWRMLYEFHII